MPRTTTFVSVIRCPPVVVSRTPYSGTTSDDGPKSLTNLPERLITGAFHGDSVQNILNGRPLVAPEAM